MTYVRPAISLTVFFVVVTGFAFPLSIWAIGSVVFPSQAHGSLIHGANGGVIGSDLIGQRFTTPKYFHPRPSAAGGGYDAANSSGTNLGPTSDKLVHGLNDDPATKDIDGSFSGFEALATAYRKENGLASDAVIPADAVTRSGSGLDPDISPANALLQVKRVADARHLPIEEVRALVTLHTAGRTLFLFGEPRVNVLRLNLALDALDNVDP
ncbi:MAG: K(+)-transporting ATPase subunit C [Polyangiaceae bacterium]